MHSHHHQRRYLRAELWFDRDNVRSYNYERRIDTLRTCVGDGIAAQQRRPSTRKRISPTSDLRKRG